MSTETRDRRVKDSDNSTATAGVRALTLGYQGRSLQEFLEIIQRNKVAQVIDVRQNARSRKPGFSALELKATLAQIGVAYVHLPELGCERESRHALWRGASADDFVNDYRRKLAEHSGALADLIQWAGKSRSLLLCLERDPARCHRTVLGEQLRANGWFVQDL